MCTRVLGLVLGVDWVDGLAAQTAVVVLLSARVVVVVLVVVARVSTMWPLHLPATGRTNSRT